MTILLSDHAVAEGLKQQRLFPIREVSRLTGVNPVTLRAWERRYGLIQPTRTDSGHRLYSHSDIEVVRSIVSWIDRGVTVSKVGKALASVQVAGAQTRALKSSVDVAERQDWQDRLRQAVNDFDETRLAHLYGQIFSLYPLVVVFQDVLMPLWHELSAHHQTLGKASEWLFLDSFLRARAMQRMQLSRADASHRVLLAPVPGPCQELDLWVAGLLMASPEMAVSVLAPGQPLEELGLVCAKMQPHALVLYSAHPPTADLPRRLLRLGLALDCPVLLAGEVSDLAQDSLLGSPIACLGSEGRLMQRRLQQFLAEKLDT